MEPISAFLLTAAGYILKGAAQSKTAKAAKGDLLQGFWNWLKPLFLEKIPEIEEKPQSQEVETKTQEHLLELIRNETFYKELEQRVNALRQAGIKEKNIVRGDIEPVKRIRIGDKVY